MTTDFTIVADYDVSPFASGMRGYGIAVDIGTTTVAMALVGPDGILGRESSLNSQIRYGSDVLSRVRAAGLGRADELRSLIRSDLYRGIGRLLSASSVTAREISLVTVAANTSMCHFLLGLPSSGLGTAPFTPEMTSYPEISLDSLLGFGPGSSPLGPLDCPVRIIPGISAFIGGDIVSGLAALDFPVRGETELFIDLGTNAEMVLSSGSSLLCASASAGPAFEGGSISCGTGSVPGAVSSVRREGSRFVYELISGGMESAERRGESADRGAGTRAKPVGLCGSGIISFLARALESGLVMPDGSLAPVCAESGVLLESGGKIRLTARDVRELQVAKAAIRAALGVLLEKAGVAEEDVSQVHLAGGFGLYLDEADAFSIGLLPRTFADKIHRAGNASLAGAVRYLSDPSLAGRFDAIMHSSTVIQLADTQSFGSRFINFMEFI